MVIGYLFKIGPLVLLLVEEVLELCIKNVFLLSKMENLVKENPL